MHPHQTVVHTILLTKFHHAPEQLSPQANLFRGPHSDDHRRSLCHRQGQNLDGSKGRRKQTRPFPRDDHLLSWVKQIGIGNMTVSHQHPGRDIIAQRDAQQCIFGTHDMDHTAIRLSRSNVIRVSRVNERRRLDDLPHVNDIRREHTVDLDERLPGGMVAPSYGEKRVASLDHVRHRRLRTDHPPLTGYRQSLSNVDASRIRKAIGMRDGVHSQAITLRDGSQGIPPLHDIHALPRKRSSRLKIRTCPC